MNVQTSYDSVLGKAGIALISVHRQRFDIKPDRLGTWDSHCFPFWTLVWSGAQGYRVRRAMTGAGSEPVARASRSWALHAPGVEFYESIDAPAAQREAMWLFFSVSGQLAPLSPRPLTLVLDRDDRVACIVRTMHGAQERGGPGDTLVAHGLLLAVLGEFIACAYDGQAGDDRDPWRLRAHEPEGKAPGLLAAVDLQVSRSPASPPSRETLAKALGMSVSSLAHRFRAETGTTLIERIRWLRIREAKTRLADGGASVKSVSASLGFSSPFYFSRVFKEVTGMTPEQYCLQCRGSAPTA